MRIALVDGGSIVMPYNFELIKALRADGIVVDYFGSETRFNGEYIEALRDLDGVTVTTRNISSSMGGNPAARLWGYVTLLLTVLRQARHFDLIALEFTPADYLETVFGWLVCSKLVFVLHNAIPHDSYHSRYGPYAAIMRQAREVWCVSPYTAQRARAVYPESADKLRIVQHGTVGATPHATPRPYTVPVLFSQLLFWGTVKPYKGVDRLLPALRENVRERVFDNIEVHGRWSPELSELKADFLEAGGEVNDTFLTTKEVMSLLRRDALFVLPYHAASQSGVLFTLMYHGRYFVASDVGEIGQMLRNLGLECLLMENFDLPNLQAKAAWMVENGSLICTRMRAAVASICWDETPKAARAFVTSYS